MNILLSMSFQNQVIELTEYMATETKILQKQVKDLDDVRTVMAALNSVKENYIDLDRKMIPIEVLYQYLIYSNSCYINRYVELSHFS